MPAAPVEFGVWEDDVFVGAVVYALGAAPSIGRPFGLQQTEVCELVRVALNTHESPVTMILAKTFKLLHARSPGLRLLVSFADSAHGHHGGIYQAGNWIYIGSKGYHVYRVNGEDVHPKTLHSRYGKGGQSIPWLRAHVDPRATRVHTPEKHKYVLPLDKRMRKRVLPLALPYPKATHADA